MMKNKKNKKKKKKKQKKKKKKEKIDDDDDCHLAERSRHHGKAVIMLMAHSGADILTNQDRSRNRSKK